MNDELTAQDIQKMQAELDDRRLRLMPELIEEVKRTRAFGDLSENYEYKAAKQEQRKNDSRVRYLQNMIKTAQIIDDDAEGGSGDKVKLYDRVTVWLPEDEEELPPDSSRDARRFAYSGGVAQAVVNAIHDMQPEREVKVAAATGLAECRKLLMMAKAGKYDGYLLEGMACPGGCIAGAGTLRPIEQSHKEVEAFSSEACFTCANDTPYMDYLPLIEEKDKIRKL